MTEEKNHQDGSTAEKPEEVSPIAAAAARRAKAAEGGMFDLSTTSTKEPAKPSTPRQRLVRGIAIAIALALAALILVTAGSGQLNVSVLSDSGAADGLSVDVALYKGDVSDVLSDGDPSNDPEPVEVNQIPVGQRTSFLVKDLGAHTLTVSFVGDDASVPDPEPQVVTMFGIDLRTTITTE